MPETAILYDEASFQGLRPDPLLISSGGLLAVPPPSPGDGTFHHADTASPRVPAVDVLHIYDRLRPGQILGVSSCRRRAVIRPSRRRS